VKGRCIGVLTAWVGVISVPGAKRKYLYASTKAALLVTVRDAQHKVDQGLPLADEQTTVGAYVAHWYDNVLPGTVRDSTQTPTPASPGRI
jgi:hypothetical protein